MTTVQNCVAVFLTLVVLSVFGVQGLSKSDDELVFAHIVSEPFLMRKMNLLKGILLKNLPKI